MAGEKFDLKSFNPQAFGKYVENIPNLKRNELIKSEALRGNSEIKRIFSDKTTTAYGTIPLFGLIDGEDLNYDGKTDGTVESTKTFEQNVVVIGRFKGWTEKDFSEDITGGTKFMSNVAKQVAKYWETRDQKILLSILKGIFSMAGMDNDDFVKKHTYDISTESGENAKVGATTLNNAMHQACGDNKDAFSIVIMNSAVATNLENIKLLNYLKYTDPTGVQRDLNMGSWNGRTVLIDDNMPTEVSGSDTIYTTYVLGKGAFYYENIGAKMPYELVRDAFTAGGRDVLFTRQRKCFAPYGISYTKTNQASNSPTYAELEDGTNWTLVNSGGTNVEFIDHKAIPIARIISKG